jgi:predicted GIY-YIG superfamily endonuclease
MDEFEIKSYSLVYVLELADGNYYVGYTTNLNHRLYQHFHGEGAKWTKVHKPIRLHSVEIGGKKRESEKTIEMMKIYGVEHVRGAGYCKSSIQTVKNLRMCDDVNN